MSIRDDFFTALSKGAKWDVGVSIARTNPLPLDANSVFKSFADLETYCGGVLAYVGQPVAVVGENETTLYVLDQNKVPQPVGTATDGDGKTIELTEDGILRLVGSADAKKGAQLVMGDNGVISWVMPDTTTVEGLSTAISALDERVDAVEETVGDHSDRITAVEGKLAGIGGIFNFVGSKSQDEFANVKAEDYDVGDVFIVDGVKEYVCVEIEVEGIKTKKWEVLGDPSGVTALEGRVETLESWKNTTSTTITEMGTDISNAKTAIQNLSTKDTELENTIAGKASKTELADVDAKTTTNAQDIRKVEGDISTINTTLAGKADKTTVESDLNEIRSTVNGKADKATVENIVANYATKEEVTQGLGAKVDTSAYNTKMSQLDSADETNANAIAGVKATADKAKDDLAALTGVVADKASAQSVTDLTGRVSKNESDISAHAQSISGLSGSVTGLNDSKADKTTVEALDKEVKANAKAISDHAAEYTALANRVTKAETDVAKAQEDATKGINDASAASTAAATAQAKGEEALAKAEAVLGTSGDTADKATVYGAKAAAAEAARLAGVAQGEVDALEGVVSALDSAYKTADAGLDIRIKALEGVIDGVQGAMHFVGVSSVDPSTGVVAIEGKDNYVAASGDVVIYKDEANNTIEYIYSAGAWVELGDVSAEAKRIEALEGRMTTAETATAKIPGIEEEIDAVQTAAAALEARVKANEDTNKSQADAIAALEGRMGVAEKAITDNMQTLRNELAAKAKELTDAISAETSARSSAVENLQGQIDNINVQLTWHKLG